MSFHNCFASRNSESSSLTTSVKFPEKCTLVSYIKAITQANILQERLRPIPRVASAFTSWKAQDPTLVELLNIRQGFGFPNTTGTWVQVSRSPK